MEYMTTHLEQEWYVLLFGSWKHVFSCFCYVAEDAFCRQSLYPHRCTLPGDVSYHEGSWARLMLLKVDDDCCTGFQKYNLLEVDCSILLDNLAQQGSHSCDVVFVVHPETSL